MKYCPYCGADLADGVASFCMECGKPRKKHEKPVGEHVGGGKLLLQILAF